jgi:hypothetical protein
MASKIGSSPKRSIFMRCVRRLPLVTSASAQPAALNRRTVSSAPGSSAIRLSRWRA